MEASVKFLILALTVFASLSPGIFIAIREAIKRQRQEIITDLAAVFDVDSGRNLHLIPSFEFVKYKYFVGARRSSDPDPARVDVTRRAAGLADPHRKREDYSTISWMIGSSFFSALAGIVMFYASSLVAHVLAGETNNPVGLSWPSAPYPLSGSLGMTWLLGVCAAFAGSFIIALRSLYRAIRNFDLSPGTLVDEAIKIILAMVLGPIITICLVKAASAGALPVLPLGTTDGVSVAIGFVVAGSFVAGVMPDVALRYIIQRDQLKNFKQEENDVFQAFKITPVEIIDGIDSDIRSRLDAHHIHSTQNLAAANPLMLFVETPYGVYQIMDWVAQAQLCCSVGRDKIVKLWPLGIRTLFDLERLAESDDDEGRALLIEVGRVILGTGLIPADLPDRSAAAAIVRRSIELRLDDPHVQRLRQIYIAVGDRLGSESRRFRNGTYRVLCRNRKQRSWTCRGLRTVRA